jgi:hypothetical protein
MIMSIRSPSLNAGHLCRRRSDEADVARGQIKHLARGMTRGHHCRQRRSAAGTAFGIMMNHNVRRHDLPQGLARMPLLPAAGLARWLAQAPGPRRLLHEGGLPLLLLSRSSRRSNSAILLCRPSINSFSAAFSVSSLSMSAFQDIFGFVRRIGPIRRLTLVA